MSTQKTPRSVIILVFLVIAWALMVFPFAIAIPGTPITDENPLGAFGYYDQVVLATGNFLPMAAGVLQIIAMLLTLAVTKFPILKKALAIVLGVSILATVLSWLIFAAYTHIAAAIVVLQGIGIAMVFVPERS